MKTTILPIIAFLAAIAAFVLLPVSAVAASISFSVIGMLCVIAADYGRSIEPVRVESPVIPFNPPGCQPAGFRQAA